MATQATTDPAPMARTAPTPRRLRALRLALVVVGLLMLLGFYPLTVVWPAGWAWHPGPSEYLAMLIGLYATLGFFLILAARDPLRHLSLIWFTIWSSVVHAGIMAVQALANPAHRGHLLGDVPALFFAAALLALLTPRHAPR
jgi:hypothetical protein